MDIHSGAGKTGAWPHALPDERVQRELQALNARFLALLEALWQGGTAGSGAHPILGLDPGLVARIAALGPDARRMVACCPYALAGLRLHDIAFWQRVAGGQLPATYRRPARQTPEPAALAVRDHLFLCLALAWHLTHTAPVAARWMLGAEGRVLALLRSVPFATLHQLAASYPGLLHARLHDQRRFWDDLVRAAESGAHQARFAAVSLGLQLSAAAGATRPGRE